MSVPKSDSSTGTVGSSPKGARFIVEIAAGAREARYVVLLVLALAAPAILGWLSIQAISGRGPIACYVPPTTHESAIPDGQESP